MKILFKLLRRLGSWQMELKVIGGLGMAWFPVDIVDCTQSIICPEKLNDYK